MLKLSSIIKEYNISGGESVTALKGIDIEFRRNEFVAILGQSGCGKTTMLNLIGGLDQYTSGDLSINGISTKKFKDRDWDSYRNHSIGFVFQSYNLIPHQSVLSNVELALTLSGVSKSERRKRAIDALTKVGLGDQIKKKPTQMSGGQMQRVAIARALVNDPDILLADEPTGALDSATSVQIMDILKEIAKDKLVIMVTHNPELAEEYSTRIVRLLDGKIIDDSNPYNSAEDTNTATSTEATDKASVDTVKASKKLKSRTSMSFFTALSLSLNNLMTKKARTLLTAFAGSIGIIGIALILSLSNGIQEYIDKVQEDTLSSYPITLEAETVDLTSLMTSLSAVESDTSDHDKDKVYTNTLMIEMVNAMMSEIQTNNLKAFNEYLKSEESGFSDYISSVKYTYNTVINVYSNNINNRFVQVNPSTLMTSMYGEMANSIPAAYSQGMSLWTEMLDDRALLETQYDVVAGKWPENYNEVVLVIDKNNEVSDIAMYSLGLKDPKEAEKTMQDIMLGNPVDSTVYSYTYDELLNLTYKLVLPSDYYQYDEATNTWVDISDNELALQSVVNNAIDLKVVGIIRPNPDAIATSIVGNIAYTSDLTTYVINATNASEIVKQQMVNPDVDVFTGIEFNVDTEDFVVTMDDVNAYIATLDEATKMQIQSYLQMMTEEQIIAMFTEQMKPETTDATYEGNLALLHSVQLDDPFSINIYAKDFESKDIISDKIDEYNQKMISEGKDEYVINYTDIVGLMMSSVSTIINVISYVLIAFVAISLVVSSIMIGIITYISVLERTKEIGILRAIGASKKDISRVFNAETMIVGFISGAIGIGATLLINIPANIIIKALTGISTLSRLPINGAIILVAISIILTLIAGLIPSRLAAKKDPVVALRSE